MAPTLLDRLVVAAQAGDHSAYERVVEACFDEVAAFVAVRISRRDDIDEVVQTTFVDGWFAIGAYDGGASLQAWLVGIARNRVLRWQREHRRGRCLIPITAVGDLLTVNDGEIDGSADELKRMRHCLERLPDAARILLRARHVEDVRLDDLANRAGLTANALATKLCRWRATLRQCIERNGAVP